VTPEDWDPPPCIVAMKYDREPMTLTARVPTYATTNDQRITYNLRVWRTDKHLHCQSVYDENRMESLDKLVQADICKQKPLLVNLSSSSQQ